MAAFAAPAPPIPQASASSALARRSEPAYDLDEEAVGPVDVDEAIVRVGESEGVFSECKGLALERDPGFPIRVTLQCVLLSSAPSLFFFASLSLKTVLSLSNCFSFRLLRISFRSKLTRSATGTTRPLPPA